MISPSSFGSPQIDPNSLRAIEQISHVINDIEQRLQIVRVALAQSVPSMPFGQTNPLASLGTTTPWTHLTPSPFQNSGVNPLAVQQLQQIQHLMALSPLVSGLFSGVPSSLPLGTGVPTGFPTSYPGLGVTPFGATSGFGAPTNPFRF